MIKIKKMFVLTSIIFTMSTLMYSCSTSNIENKQDENKDKIINNLTKEQIKFINKNNINSLILKFEGLLKNKILDLNIFPNLEIIENETFINKEINYIKFNEKIKIIKENAFLNIKSLKELKIPISLKSIEKNAFNNAFQDDSLVNLNNSCIENIGENAFSKNKNLKILSNNPNINNLIKNSKFEGSIIENNNDQGGEFSGLQVNKYLSIISNLSINKKTNISSLNDQLLTNELKNKNPNKNYLIEILDNSSESKGILRLKLIEKNDNIDENIEILGFQSLKNKNYFISEANINSSKWFKNKQLKENINNWSNENWIEYLSKLEISLENNKEIHNLIELSNSLDIQFIYNDNKQSFSIKLSTNYKKYKNKTWIKDEIQPIIGKRLSSFNGTDYKITFPNNDELFNFIKNNLNIIGANKDLYISKRYASYYLYEINGLLIKNSLNNILEISNEYKSYLKSYLNINPNDILSLEFQDAFPNDIDGILNLNYKLVSYPKIASSTTKTHFLGSYEISGFKKYSENINFQISLLPNQKRFISLKKQINSQISKNEFKNMLNGEIKQLDNFGFLSSMQSHKIETLQLLIDDDLTQENIKRNKIKTVIENFSMILNNIDIVEDSFFYKTNYFYNSTRANQKDKGIIIRNLYLSTDKENKAKIEKNGNIWIYKFPITINLELNNSTSFSILSSKVITKNIECSMTLLKNDIDSML